MAEIRLNGVKKSYGPVDVIHGVDLEVAANEFVVFVGPSGCGKSTLLRMIEGLEETNAGSIEIGDRDVTKLQPVDRNVAMVFQSYALYPHMTVEENIGFALKANGMDKMEVKKHVDEAAKSLQLEDCKPRALSSGQRVAIGRAIVRNPDVFLFDEPLSNLDAELRVHMRIEIARLHKRLGATMIYVTHDQVEAMTLADKIVVLQLGRFMQVGTPLSLFDDPDNQFVAGFIGSPKMNFLPADLVGWENGIATVDLPTVGAEKLELPLSSTEIEVGQKAILGVRPEHFTSDAREGVKITLTADVIERLGDDCYIYANTKTDDQIMIERNNDRSTTEGDELSITIPRNKAFLFREDGKRIR